MAIKGKIIIDGTSGNELKRVFDKLKTLKSDGRYRIFILDTKLLRSTSQNRYYWFGIGIISEHTGISTEDLHELLKHKFNLKTSQLGNELIEYGSSTKLLNTLEMTQYIDKIRQWSQDTLNCYIPSPNEMTDESIIELINRGI